MDHVPGDLTNDYHLFGFDGDEYLHRDLASVVEDRVFEERDDPEFTVTEWTSRPVSMYLPTADRLLEYILDIVGDDCGFEEGYEAMESALDKEPVKVAAEQLLQTIRDHTVDGFRFADKVVRTYCFTWDADSRLLCDGVPFWPEDTRG